MDKLININCELVYADDKYQIYDMLSDENITLRQLECAKVKVNLKIEFENPILKMEFENSDDYILAFFTNSNNANEQINVKNSFMPITNNGSYCVTIYNISNFKGLTIKKGDIIGSVVIGY